MAKKAKAKTGSGTLGEIATSLGSLLGNAEKQWRAWQGPRDAVVKAVTDVRDRAAALLSEMGAAAETVTGKGSKKGKKKDKKGKKDKKDRKDKKDKKARKGKAEKALTDNDDKAAKAGKAEKKNPKDAKSAKSARRTTGRKKKTRAPSARTVADAPAAAPTAAPPAADGADYIGADADDTAEP